MPRPQSKRDLILKSTVYRYDQSDIDATGHHLRGGAHGDRLDATDDQAWWIEGRGATDAITGAGGDDLLVAGKVLLGDAGDDGDPDRDDAIGVADSTIPGGASIDGAGGNDLVVGGLGGDLLVGGNGNDSLWGFDGDDDLRGEAGDDLLAPGLGTATISGGDGLDTVTWSDLAYTKGRGDLPGVVLNLSDRLIRYESGDQIGEGRILVQAPTGGFVLLGEADTTRSRPDARPEGEVDLDISAGTATVAIGLLLPAVQKVREAAARMDVERFDGTLGLADVAVLEDGFAFVGTTVDGWARYARGAEALEFRGFEVILIA